MTLATYVLVHGGAHGGWCYGPVARALRAAGHEVHTPTMTGVGERSHLLRPDIDLDFHIRDILAVLQYEDLRDVILVGHSYGGMVITGVADRAPDRVGHLVYLDAAMPEQGQSLADIAAPLMEAARRESAHRRRRGARALPRHRADAELRRHRSRHHRVDERAAHTPPVEVLHPAARGSRTRPRCGRSRRPSSAARRRSRSGTRPASPAPRAGCGTSTPATTS